MGWGTRTVIGDGTPREHARCALHVGDWAAVGPGLPLLPSVTAFSNNNSPVRTRHGPHRLALGCCVALRAPWFPGTWCVEHAEQPTLLRFNLQACVCSSTRRRAAHPERQRGQREPQKLVGSAGRRHGNCARRGGTTTGGGHVKAARSQLSPGEVSKRFHTNSKTTRGGSSSRVERAPPRSRHGRSDAMGLITPSSSWRSPPATTTLARRDER